MALITFCESDARKNFWKPLLLASWSARQMAIASASSGDPMCSATVDPFGILDVELDEKIQPSPAIFCPSFQAASDMHRIVSRSQIPNLGTKRSNLVLLSSWVLALGCSAHGVVHGLLA